MATSSISGLVSGLDTATIISQLMQLEAIPQAKLQSQLNSAKTSLASLQTLNSQVAGIATNAKELASIGNWSPLKATSTLSSVSATATSSATSGTWNVQVDRMATHHRMRFDAGAALDDVVVTGGTTVSLTMGGTTTEIDTGDGTLSGLVKALNADGTGVQASTIRLDDGTHRLVVQSRETGESHRFTLTSANGDPLLSGASVVNAEDAAVTVEGHTVHSSTNSFADVVPGLSFTISADAIGKSAGLTVGTDTTKAATAVKALVDQVNNVIGQIQSLTGFNATTKTTGSLARDSAVRAVGVALQQAVFPTDNTSLASLGIQTDRSGKLTFDVDKFNEALASNPSGVAAAITGPTGFAARVHDVAKAASDSTSGTLTSAVTGRNSSIAMLTSSIESWDTRLELRRTSLERQYTALETALSRMNSQSSWLTSQIAALSSSS